VVTREELLAAYERFHKVFGPGRHELPSFVMMGPDYEGGRLCFVLDAGSEPAQRDAEAIRAWALEIAPATVEVLVQVNPPRASPAAR
jgi:hypothetical protein